MVKVPRGGRPGYFAKGDFKIDLVQDRVTCPAGQTATKWQLLLAAAVANLVLVAAWESATGGSPGLGTSSFSLLLQLTFFLLLVPSLIGVAKRRQHLVLTALARGCVPQTPGFRPDSQGQNVGQPIAVVEFDPERSFRVLRH